MTSKKSQDKVKTGSGGGLKQPTPEEEEKALADAKENPVSFTRVDKDKLKAREGGEDFVGNLTEFDFAFEWVWVDPNTKLLFDLKSNSAFTGTVLIKDKKLDKKTYSGQQQEVKFEEGKIKFIDSRPVDEE